MGEIKVTKWKCDICFGIYDNKKDYDKCILRHRNEELIVLPGNVITVGIPRMVQGYMGGPIEFEGYDWTTGRVVAKRNAEDGPEALIEVDGERNWTSAWVIMDWAKVKKAEDYRKQHPINYSNISCVSIVSTIPKSGAIKE